MPQNSIELLQKLMEKYSRVFMSFARKQGVPYDDVEDIVMASFWHHSGHVIRVVTWKR